LHSDDFGPIQSILLRRDCYLIRLATQRPA
jgi:hypothetical protein